MILGGGDPGAGGNRTTLDDLFRRAGVRRSDGMALIDPPNLPSARRLTFAEADRAISKLAGRLQEFGLPADTVVAIQLANTAEAIIALLGVLRAGMIAAPVPLLWRKHDMVAALGRVGAKVIMAGSGAGAEVAMQAAAELFPIRYVCGFGVDLPDGVAALDDVFAPGPADAIHPPARAGNPAAHIAVVTFDVTAAGITPVARNHLELIAGGVAVLLEAGIGEDAAILSAIPASSFAGIAATLIPWMINGGTLALHHDFDKEAFAAQCQTQEPAMLVLPAMALMPLKDTDIVDGAKKIMAVWRSPERLTACTPWQEEATVIDIACFGEVGLIPARRGIDGMPTPTPSGTIAAPRGAAGAIAIVETTRTRAGTLALRGPMVPVHTFPPGDEPEKARDAFADTGFTCRRERASGTITVSGPPGGLTVIGGYRFRQNDVDWLVAKADLDATIVALPDALLGQCFAGSAPKRSDTAIALQALGANPLIAGAFRARPAGKAA